MDGVVFIEFDNGVWGRGVSLLFSWPPVREVCTNDEVVMFQPGTGKPPELGSIDNCYIAILLILDLPFYDRHPMSAWGGATHSCPFPLTLSDRHVSTQDHSPTISGFGVLVMDMTWFMWAVLDWVAYLWRSMKLVGLTVNIWSGLVVVNGTVDSWGSYRLEWGFEPLLSFI